MKQFLRLFSRGSITSLHQTKKLPATRFFGIVLSLSASVILCLVTISNSQCCFASENALLPFTISPATQPFIIGNGQLAARIQQATVSHQIWQMNCHLSGNQWNYATAPPVRADLGTLRWEANPAQGSTSAVRATPEEILYDIHKGCVYASEEFHFTPRFHMAVAAASPLLYLRASFPVGFGGKLSVQVPPHPKGIIEPIEPTIYPQQNACLCAVGQKLPNRESYLLALYVAAPGLQAVSTSHSVEVSWSSAEQVDVRLGLVSESDFVTLTRQLHDWGNQQQRLTTEQLDQERENCWSDVWAENEFSFRCRDGNLTQTVNHLWHGLLHAYRVHAMGPIPPADSGFWPSDTQGRFWPETLEAIYQPLVRLNQAENIRCVDFCLEQLNHFALGEEQHSLFFPQECGPDLVAASMVNSYLKVFDAVFGPEDLTTPATTWDRWSWGMLLEEVWQTGQWSPSFDSLYPYLRLLANPGNQTWDNKEGLSEYEKQQAFHIARLSIEVAQRLQIDPARVTEWQAKVVQQELLAIDTQTVTPSQINYRTWQDFTPDGLPVVASGFPSLVVAGVLLQQLLDDICRLENGVLRILPGFSGCKDLLFSVKNIHLPEGIKVVNLYVRHGVLDPVAITTTQTTSVTFEHPNQWDNCSVADISDPSLPQVIPINRVGDSAGRRIYEFESEGGHTYLLGPNF